MTKPEIVCLSAESRLGDPYVFGARGEDCTPKNRDHYAKPAYPTIVSKCQVLSKRKKTCDGCPYRGRHIYDCRGFTYRCMLDADIKIMGAGATTQYGDKNNWAVRGTTDRLPDCVCCIFKHRDDGKMSHTGLHIGGGHIRHCSGEVKTGVIDRNWTHFGIPKGLYTEEEIKEMGVIIVMSVLKRGSKGDNVKELQQNLVKLGYLCGEADGKFGKQTEAAVRSFQKDNGLKEDGIAGSVTQTVINTLLAGKQPQNDESTEAPKTTEERLAALEEAVALLMERVGLK